MLLDPEFWERRFEPLLAAMFAAGAALMIASSFTGGSSQVIVGDAANYYEYARVLAVEGHLPVLPIKYPCGVSMVGILGLAPYRAAASALHAAGVGPGPSSGGWGRLDQIFFCLPLIVLAWLAARANLAMLRRAGFADRIAKPAVLFWIAGTNIAYYFFKEPAMSEASTYAWLSFYYLILVGAFADLFSGAKNSAAAPSSPRPANSGNLLRSCFLAGLALGFACAVRQQNVLHAFALAALLLLRAGRGLAGRDSRSAALRISASLLLPAAASALGFVLLAAVPYLVWSAARDPVRLYTYGNEGFRFLSPALFEVLFVPFYHGLFVWHPIFALAAAGWVAFARRERAFAAAALPILFAQWYLVASWWWPSFGSSVGHRGFFTCMPLLLFGFTELWARADARGRSRPLAGAVLALTIWNLVLSLLLAMRIVSAAGKDPEIFPEKQPAAATAEYAPSSPPPSEAPQSATTNS